MAGEGDRRGHRGKEQPSPTVDGRRRSFFRLLLNPLSAVVQGYELPPNHTSQNPPQQHRVIRPGPGNRSVLALIGPMATGTGAPGGFGLHAVEVGEREIRYVFACEERTVEVVLAEPGLRHGALVGNTSSFEVLVAGSAAEEERRAVAAQVLVEARARDQGQLWITADLAPARRPPGGRNG